MICENCSVAHSGKYGSGRFCSQTCARGFSTKAKRKEINQKVSDKLRGSKSSGKPFKTGFDNRRRILSDSDREKALCIKKQKRAELYQTLSFNDLPQAEKRRVILNKQNGLCGECHISKWNGKDLVLELHHKNCNNLDNTKENLIFLCPNCHSLTEGFRGRRE